MWEACPLISLFSHLTVVIHLQVIIFEGTPDENEVSVLEMTSNLMETEKIIKNG